MFGALSGCYDRLNRTMTLGQDQRWRKAMVEATCRHEPKPKHVLDLASGTGDVALLFQKNGIHVIACDFSAAMLARAEDKGVRETRVADALNLPFENESFDAVTVAWGFRNFEDRELAAREVWRVLRPGGGFFILESSEPDDWTRPFHRLYCRQIIPRLGALLAGNAAAYHYLVETVAEFPAPTKLAEDLEHCGFTGVRWRTFFFGAACLHSAEKPPREGGHPARSQ